MKGAKPGCSGEMLSEENVLPLSPVPAGPTGDGLGAYSKPSPPFLGLDSLQINWNCWGWWCEGSARAPSAEREPPMDSRWQLRAALESLGLKLLKTSFLPESAESLVTSPFKGVSCSSAKLLPTALLPKSTSSRICLCGRAPQILGTSKIQTLPKPL